MELSKRESPEQKNHDVQSVENGSTSPVDLRNRVGVAAGGPEESTIYMPPVRLDKIMAHQDHVVVPDLTSEKGFKSVPLAALADTPHRTKLFIGTAKECIAWVAAPDAAGRQEVERWAAERLKRRIPLPSEGLRRQAEIAGIVDKFKVKIRDVQTSLFGNSSSPGQDQQIKM